MDKKKKPKFLRKDTRKLLKLGVKRKSKQKWRKPNGPDNKIRLKLKSRGAWPAIGYSKPRADRGKIQGLVPVMIYNVNDLSRVKAENIAIIGKVGLKNKIEITKKAKELGIKVNLDLDKFLQDTSRKIEEKKAKKLDTKKKIDAKTLKQDEKKKDDLEKQKKDEDKEKDKEKKEEKDTREEQEDKEAKEKKKIMMQQTEKEKKIQAPKTEARQVEARQVIRRMALQK